MADPWCPPGTHFDPWVGGCVLDISGSPPGMTPPTPPSSVTPGGGPGSCPPGQVWRPDTNQCEAPDQRSKEGKETCTGPEPSCPPGQCSWCDFDDMQKKCAPCGTGGGGKGGGGGGIKPADPFGGLAGEANKQIWEQIQKMLAGGATRYTPEVLGFMDAQAKAATQGAASAAQQNLANEQIKRGVFRSPFAARGAADIQRASAGDYAKAVTAIRVQKAQTDFEDRVNTLKLAQGWLDSLRDSILKSTALKNQKDYWMAQIQLGYANIASQMELLLKNWELQLPWLVAGQIPK